MNRTGLIILQVVGALSVLPYPAILVANVMSIAAPGQTIAGAMPFLLLSLYPLVWAALYFVSWRAMSHGAVGLAFGLSSIPSFACLVLIGYWAIGWASFGKSQLSKTDEVRKQIQAVNPLLWTIWCTAPEHHFPPGPSVPAAEALRAIESSPAMINIAVAPYGTPLKVALNNLSIQFDGSAITNPAHQEDLFRVVRALVAAGAQLAADEKDDLRLSWRLKRALHEGPIDTADENRLVWRILTRKRDGVTLFSLQRDEMPLLNKSTSLHGTPLYAALLQDGPDATEELIKAGARLSPDEERDPAAAAALSRTFERSPELRRVYQKGK
jgi:hypothetical protein